MKQVSRRPPAPFQPVSLASYHQLLVSDDLMPALVAPITYKNPVARLHCLLALKNLAYWAESPLKKLLMETLTWEHLVLYVAIMSEVNSEH